MKDAVIKELKNKNDDIVDVSKQIMSASRLSFKQLSLGEVTSRESHR